MSRKLERDQLAAELAGLNALLSTTPQNDLAGRYSLEEKKQEILAVIEHLEQAPDNQASVALFFGGKPVVGSRSIKADFASGVLSTFQELVSKLWAEAAGEPLGARGPIREAEAAQLHITNIVHGSFGFLLEEMDHTGALFASRLKTAVGAAVNILSGFAEENEQGFNQIIEEIDPRVFTSVRELFKRIHRDEGVLRLVESDTDKQFDRVAIERAYERVEASAIDENEMRVEGELLGVIPIARRFEFRDRQGNLLTGKVATTLSENYLERINREQFAGKFWRARVRRKEIRRFGAIAERYTFLDLEDINPDGLILPPPAH